MTAWAISVVDGDGSAPRLIHTAVQGVTRPQDRTEGPYRARAAEYGSCTVLIPGNPDGSPRKSWCLCRLGDDADLVAADADPGVVVLDSGDLERVLNGGAANQVNARLAAAGVTTVALAGMTVRQVLVELCVELGEPGWGPVG